MSKFALCKEGMVAMLILLQYNEHTLILKKSYLIVKVKEQQFREKMIKYNEIINQSLQVIKNSNS